MWKIVGCGMDNIMFILGRYWSFLYEADMFHNATFNDLKVKKENLVH